MHGPWRANLERSNQSAHKQSAQPEETPPRRAGKRAKACLRAISVAACGSEWTSRPASFSKNWTIAGSRHAPGSPAPRTLFTRKSLMQAETRRSCSPLRDYFQSQRLAASATRIRPASSRSSPIAGAFQAGRYPLHRKDKDTAFLRTKFVSRRGFDFVLRSLPSPTAELRGK
jgi:hypothetical protein